MNVLLTLMIKDNIPKSILINNLKTCHKNNFKGPHISCLYFILILYSNLLTLA